MLTEIEYEKYNLCSYYTSLLGSTGNNSTGVTVGTGSKFLLWGLHLTAGSQVGTYGKIDLNVSGGAAEIKMFEWYMSPAGINYSKDFTCPLAVGAGSRLTYACTLPSGTLTLQGYYMIV